MVYDVKNESKVKSQEVHLLFIACKCGKWYN